MEGQGKRGGGNRREKKKYLGKRGKTRSGKRGRRT